MAEKEKSTILLIDDDNSLLVTLSDFLTFEGYKVVTAESGEQGLGRLRELHPDLIILDMSMPGMGGVGFLREISSADGKPRYPVLVLTARANMAEFFADVDVDGFVAKPCNPEDLLMEVGRIIFLRRGENEAPVGESAQRKVLIGEDDGEILDGIRQGFEREGFAVETVDKGPEVLEKAIIHQPDAIIVKRVFSGMNGDAVAGLLAQMPNTRDIPVVLYDHENVEAATERYVRAESGVTAFVRSHEPEALVAAVTKVLLTT